MTISTAEPLRSEPAHPRHRRWLWAVAGPLLFGAIIGVVGTIGDVARTAVAVPATLAATVALTLPALFVLLSYQKLGPPLRDFVHLSASSLESLGLVLAGLSPALLFLIATGSEFDALPLLLGALFIAVAAIVTVMGLFQRLIDEQDHARALPTFVPWAMVALGVGLHLYGKYVAESLA